MAIAGTRALVIVIDTNVVASNSLTGVGSALNDVDLDRLIVLIVGKYIGDRGSRDQGDEKSANGHRRDAHDIASSRGGWPRSNRNHESGDATTNNNNGADCVVVARGTVCFVVELTFSQPAMRATRFSIPGYHTTCGMASKCLEQIRVQQAAVATQQGRRTHVEDARSGDTGSEPTLSGDTATA